MSFYIRDCCNFSYEVEKSKFIAFSIPCETLNEVDNEINLIKTQYPKATHYVYAFKGQNVQKMSDNGEPSGTAGKPILDVLNKRDIVNILIVVVRYFGGTKLGASRLLRTYLNCAIEAINQEKLYERSIIYKYDIEVDINKKKIFENFYMQNNINITKIMYNSNVIEYSFCFNSDICLLLSNIDGVKIVKNGKDFGYLEVK